MIIQVGLHQSFKEAFKYYQFAAEHGEPSAYRYLKEICREIGKDFNISWVAKRSTFEKGTHRFIDVLKKLGDVIAFIRIPTHLKIRIPTCNHIYFSHPGYGKKEHHMIRALQFYSNQMEQLEKFSKSLKNKHKKYR